MEVMYPKGRSCNTSLLMQHLADLTLSSHPFRDCHNMRIRPDDVAAGLLIEEDRKFDVRLPRCKLAST